MRVIWAWLNGKLGVDAGHDYVYRRILMAESRVAYIEAWIANLDAEVSRIVSESLGVQPPAPSGTLPDDPKAHAKQIVERIMAAKVRFPKTEAR
jgi:hypothetical protein